MNEADRKNLKLRLISAAVLASVSVAAIYFGGFLYALFIAVFAFAALYEWNILASKTDKVLLLLVVGFFYVSAVSVVLWFLRQFAWEFLLFFFVSVWLSDSFAYLFGKFLKGPKLLPSVSPNKTWSGFVGACVGPFLAGVGMYFVQNNGENVPVDFFWILIYGGVIGFSGQAGDLFVSKIKRMANVKDSGGLIPGHGGVLDRIDSLMMASLFVFMFMLLLSFYTDVSVASL